MLGGPSVIKSLWHLVEVYWIFYQPPTVDTNNGNYSHTYLFIYTTVYGWQGETKLKSAVKQTGWSAENCFLSLHYSWIFFFFTSEDEAQICTAEAFSVLHYWQSHRRLAEAPLFDLAQVKSDKRLCTPGSRCQNHLSDFTPYFFPFDLLNHPHTFLSLLDNKPDFRVFGWGMKNSNFVEEHYENTKEFLLI